MAYAKAGFLTGYARYSSGRVATGTVDVFDAGTQNRSTLYTNAAKAGGNTTAVDVGTDGKWSFFAIPGSYDLVFSHGVTLAGVVVAPSPDGWNDIAGVGFYGGAGVAKPTVSGAKGSNAALASLLTALASQGLITDSSSA